ncbi:MAG: MFS transporter [Caldilineaceae bacterium]
MSTNEAATATVSALDNEPTTVEKLHGLPWSIASNAFNTVFVQYTFFGSIFVLFLSALGLSKAQMGFLLSLMPFFGLIALFVAPAVERYGYKRSYITFFGLRNIATIGLLATPWVVNQYGSTAALRYVAIVIAVFSALRALGVTASFPWVQQYVPPSMQGKYTATNNMVTTTTGFVAVTLGGVVLARMAGLSGFMLLIGVGICFGLLSVSLAMMIPGGAPRPATKDTESKRDLGTAVRDPNMARFLVSSGLITLAIVPLNSFVPLFMREEIGLSDSRVVWLQTGALVGTLLSSYLWGWAADRYGSLPVAQYGLTLRSTLPFFWMLMPRHSPISLYIALSIAFMQGLADMGWGIGSARLLYVNIVPGAKRRDYMAVYYAWIGVVAGISQLSSGRILEVTQGLSGQFGFLTIDPYFPLFVVGIIMPILSIFLLRTIRVDQKIGMSRFAGIFLRGNPFLAMTSMMRFYVSRDEDSAVRITEQLGQSKSPLTVEELLSALDDPRFNVRFEAVISIARSAPEPRLIARLEEILHGKELALSAVAAWALGRLHDPDATEALKSSLDSEYRSIRAASARALGSLGDESIAPELLDRIYTETDKGLLMAYASPLGKFQVAEAAPRIIELLDEIHNPGARMELALTLARIVGDEGHFIQLFRAVENDADTALSQAVATFQKQLTASGATDEQELARECANCLARGELAQGAVGLSQLIRALPKEHCTSTCVLILDACANHLSSGEDVRPEYIILALHTLQIAWHNT